MEPNAALALTLAAVVASASIAGHNHPAVMPDDSGVEWAYMPAPTKPAILAISSNSNMRYGSFTANALIVAE
jgi:hypothetical protein